MPRKKKPVADAATVETTAATAVAEPENKPEQPTAVPAWIDGPQVVADAPAAHTAVSETPTEGQGYGPTNPEAKNWGPPYKAIVTTETFEMGENRRFKQRVFTFKEKPDAEVIAKLKDNGFVYRASEKAWTIPANPDTRKLSDGLARDLAGQSQGQFR